MRSGVARISRIVRSAVTLSLVHERKYHCSGCPPQGVRMCCETPVRAGTFRMDHPFTDLPNVVASPHNSASVPESRTLGLQRAVANCARALRGETPLHLVRPEDRMQ